MKWNELINEKTTFLLILLVIFIQIISGISGSMKNNKNRSADRIQIKKLHQLVEFVKVLDSLHTLKLDQAVEKILILEKLTDSPEQDTTDVKQLLLYW